MLKTVLKKEEWRNGHYFTKTKTYVKEIICDSNKNKVRKQFKKITRFYNGLDHIVVYLAERPEFDIPIKYR